jgi:hypothetical protein
VLDPARLGENLLVFELVGAHGLTSVVENHAAGTGRTLVNSGNILGHVRVSLRIGTPAGG